MGNTTARPTNRLNLLIQEVQDFSFNLSQNISQIAEQSIVSVQTQDVEIGIGQLQGCQIDITQSGKIMAKQEGLFKAVFTNPRELIKKIAIGPDSILQQAMDSKSKVMQDFLNVAKDKLGAETNSDLQLKLTNILKIHIDQNSIQRCSQNIFTSQTQKVKILGEICKESKIRVAQDLIISAAQDCFFEVTQNALMEDPTMRSAVREFNGDYANGYLDDQLDAGAKIPEACFNTGKITYRNPITGEDGPVAGSGLIAGSTNNLFEGVENQDAKARLEKHISKLRRINSTLLIILVVSIIFIFYLLYKKN